MRHLPFIARTVFVQNNNIEEACRVLNRILGKEGILDQFRRTRFYEKPFQVGCEQIIYVPVYWYCGVQALGSMLL